MIGVRVWILGAVLIGTAAIARAPAPYLKEVPKDGEVPHGKVVYVDDGKCPKGEVKEVTAGAVRSRFRERSAA